MGGGYAVEETIEAVNSGGGGGVLGLGLLGGLLLGVLLLL